MQAPWVNRTGVRLGRRFALAAATAALIAGTGCGEGSPGAIAARILARYQKVSGSKPLTAGGMIRLRLLSAGGSGASGSSEILWEPWRYRESVASAGWTAVRGIEFGRAYFTDPDGVTRVVSDQVLRELITRSYFWRRAWLFQDRGGARVRLGPANGEEVSIQLQPPGGNPLVLTFARRDGRLRSARSPRFALEFSDENSLRDLSDSSRPIQGEIVWSGLPIGSIPKPEAGGSRARFEEPAEGAPYDLAGGTLVVGARLNGKPVRLALDAATSGPLRLSAAVSGSLGIVPRPDVDIYGRRVAGGVKLEVAGLTDPSILVQEAEGLPPGADAVAGATLFREAVVEIDPDRKRLALHDPDLWAPPEGYTRVVIDDDGDLPVAVLDRGSQALRLALGSDLGAAALELDAVSAARAGLGGKSEAANLFWGSVKLPPLPLRIVDRGYSTDWGEDGRLGFALLLRFHVFVDMPQRWVYLRASRDAGPSPK